MGFKSILVISDLHSPWMHPDTIDFLSALKKEFKPDRVVSIGDEADFHALSFHDSDPDLPSSGFELKLAVKRLEPIYKLFPKMDILESNHGSMVFRKALANNIPAGAIKSYREVLQAPKGWKWHDGLTVKASNGSLIYFCHSKGSNVLSVSQAMGMSVVQGHHHNLFEIRYWGNPLGLYFGMTVGCMINDKDRAFAYSRVTVKRPVIGCAVITEGIPRLCPMVLNKDGRWLKRFYW